MAAIETAHDILRAGRRPLDVFFAPRTVAVIGATETAGSVGRTILWNLISSPFGGTVFPVNPKRASVLGIKAYPKITEAPEEVDLAVVVVPAPGVPAVIGECVQARVKAAIVISAGFKETGAEGAALERQVLEQARRGKMRIIGPNCLGVMSPVTGLNATFAGAMARAGSVGFVSQSGALCTAILDWSLREHVGFSAFVSIGSMLDVGWGDLIDYLGEDPRTESIVLYMESIGDARAFLSAAREVALAKPIIVIKAGRSEAAAKAAASHTGALAGSDEVLDAAFRRSGVLRVPTIADLFYMAEVLAKQPRPAGPRLTILTNAGGPGVLATDALIAAGGELAELSCETIDELNRILPAHWSRHNPIDILGDAGPERYAKSVEIAARDATSDGLLVILTPQAMTDPTRTAEEIKPYAKLPGKPILASWMGGSDVATGENILNRAGIPTFAYPDSAARAFHYMWRYSYNLRGLYETPAPEEDGGRAAGGELAREEDGGRTAGGEQAREDDGGRAAGSESAPEEDGGRAAGEELAAQKAGDGEGMPGRAARRAGDDEGQADGAGMARMAEGGAEAGRGGAGRAEARRIIDGARGAGRTLLTELESKRLLAAYGIPAVETRAAGSEDEAVRAAGAIGYPVAVKLLSETITHKTDVGGVQLNLSDEAAVRRAWRAIESSVREKAGEGHFGGVTVQPMVRWEGYEIIIGSSLDAQFGPVLLFGAGGQLVEVFRDRALALPPLNTTLARRMMEQTRIFKALKGVRGRRAVDLAALDQLLVRFSRLVVEQRWIKEIDINPLLASAERLIALDARVALHGAETREEDLPRLAIRPYPAQYVSPWTAKDGEALTIRPIRPEDEPMIVKFHQTLSEQSVYFRYFHVMSLTQRVAHERLTRICFIDYDREMALVAEQGRGQNGEREIAGVGRLTRTREEGEAEFAVLVSDRFHERGLGTELVRRLIEVSRAEKVRRVTADILTDNRAMQRICQRLGFQLRHSAEEDVVKAELALG